jgi:ABC-2 type transport system ATP-binding protein
VAEGSPAACEDVLARFGECLPAKDGTLIVELAGGAAEIAPVVRALDERGILVESLELVEPTLDDVFVEKTGQHLEESDEPLPGQAGRVAE